MNRIQSIRVKVVLGLVVVAIITIDVLLILNVFNKDLSEADPPPSKNEEQAEAKILTEEECI